MKNKNPTAMPESSLDGYPMFKASKDFKNQTIYIVDDGDGGIAAEIMQRGDKWVAWADLGNYPDAEPIVGDADNSWTDEVKFDTPQAAAAALILCGVDYAEAQ